MQKFFISALFLILFQQGKSQITVTGATCVTRGTEYQYFIAGGEDSATSTQVCVSGGIITGNGAACVTTTALTQVHVLWNNDTLTSGVITVTINGNTQTLTVGITPFLNGGGIDSAVKNQVVDSGVIPYPIHCSVATGGACTPAYTYKWQQSTDNLSWSDMDSSTSPNLSFTSAVANSTYFRRRTVETTSNSTAYSDVAAVFVNPPVNGTGFRNGQQEALKAMAKAVVTENTPRHS
jgi:hypothetical protein